MKMRFNIALIPNSKSNDFINFAKNLYSIAGNYRLGEESIPHITLCQFMAEESDVETIWQKVQTSSVNKSIKLSLDNFDNITIDNSSWVSLQPNNLENLMSMHCEIAGLIESRIGRCFDKYDAHMSIINTTYDNYNQIVASLRYKPIEDEFIVSLGISDDIGQLKKILYSSEITEKNNLKMRY